MFWFRKTCAGMAYFYRCNYRKLWKHPLQKPCSAIEIVLSDTGMIMHSLFFYVVESSFVPSSLFTSCIPAKQHRSYFFFIVKLWWCVTVRRMQKLNQKLKFWLIHIEMSLLLQKAVFFCDIFTPKWEMYFSGLTGQ